ncbi:hypothetical protein ACJIZ3_004330 [Penstemon smallii]|uniref:Glutamate receptor n=1 Tax=Penstemon smallii TaxID=265156 RepID=A0ABD3S1W5_9LAMI
MEEKIISHLLFLIVVLLIFSFTTKTGTAQKIRVGVVIDKEEQMGWTCISMALSEFYAKHDNYKTRLVLFNRDSKGDVVGASAAAVDLVKNFEVQAIIGPLYSVQTNFLIALGDKAQVPIITFSATNPSLWSIRSPYFIRATLSDSNQVKAISAIVQAHGWREVVLIYEDNEFGEGIIPFLTDALEQVNARVPYRSIIPSLATDDQIVAELYNMMTMQTRVFVVHMMIGLGSRLFTKAKELGMMSDEYVWIITDGMANELTSMDPLIIESMLGVIGVKPYTPKTEELDSFTIRYKKRIQQSSPTVVSPDLNIFGLWAYDSVTALAMAAEAARLRSPRFTYANISRNSTDLEAFGVSDNGPKLVHALSNTAFKGLAGNFRLVDGQLQAPPYQIINLVGPGARVVGYWTKENGIVKDLNFTSLTTNTYSTKKSNFGTITWPGDKKNPAKGWVIPTKGKKLRIGVPSQSGIKEFVNVTWGLDNSIEVKGYCIDVFELVMKKLPYGVPYEYIPFAADDHTMAGNYNDLTYQKYDAVVGDVTIVANRSLYVDFTLPYTESGVSIVVPIKNVKSKNSWVFIKPFTWELWLTIFCSFLFFGFLIWILERPETAHLKNLHWHEVSGKIFWFAFITMVFAHMDGLRSKLANFLLFIWFLVVIILVQSYTASFSSMLTIQTLKPSVTDANELLRNKDYVGYKNGSFVHDFLIKMGFEESRIVPFNSPEQMDELLTKGNRIGGIAAAFDEIPYLKLFLAKYCKNYTMVDSVYKAGGFGFVFPMGSPLVPDVSRAILNVTEGKILVDIETTWLGHNTKCPDSDNSHRPQNLGLESFRGLFATMGIAGIVAFIIRVIRFLRNNNNNNNNQKIWSKFIEEQSSPPEEIWNKIAVLLPQYIEAMDPNPNPNPNPDPREIRREIARLLLLFPPDTSKETWRIELTRTIT